MDEAIGSKSDILSAVGKTEMGTRLVIGYCRYTRGFVILKILYGNFKSYKREESCAKFIPVSAHVAVLSRTPHPPSHVVGEDHMDKTRKCAQAQNRASSFKDCLGYGRR